MILAIISALFRLTLTIMVVKLLTHRDLAGVFNLRERRGLGLMGGSGLLTIPVILDVNSHGTPFDIVAGLAFSAGAVTFLWGFTDRKLGHARRNQEQARQSEAYLRARGKL